MNETDELASPLDQALRPYRDALASDGYELEFHPGQPGKGSTVRVLATDAACPDCLVPKDLMATMLSDGLRNAGIEEVLPLVITYPSDAR